VRGWGEGGGGTPGRSSSVGSLQSVKPIAAQGEIDSSLFAGCVTASDVQVIVPSDLWPGMPNVRYLSSSC